MFIGSLNLDPRSVDINTEMGIVFHSPEMAGASREALLDEEGLKHSLRAEARPIAGGEQRRVHDLHLGYRVELERVGGETIRHTSEPGDRCLGHRSSCSSAVMAPESLI